MNSNSQNSQSVLTQSPSKVSIGSLLDSLDEETRARVLDTRYIRHPLAWSKNKIEKRLQLDLAEVSFYDAELGYFDRFARGTGHRHLGRMGSLHPTGYQMIRVDSKAYQESRLVYLWVTGSLPSTTQQIDHINKAKDDNRLSNLRLVSQAINSRNKKKQSNNRSGYTGVYFDSAKGYYRACVRVSGRLIYMGNFNDAFKAHQAREEWLAARPELGFTSSHGK
jgi:hypothetical protein